MKRLNDFPVLSLSEESMLSKDALNQYYFNLRQYYKEYPIKLKLKNIRRIIHPVLRKTMGLTVKNKVIIVRKSDWVKTCPVIYAVNHTNVHDVPVFSSAIKNHFYVLAGDEVRRDINGLLFWLNGVVWVDRANKESRASAKEDIIQIILRNQVDFLIFPEGTWNMTENKLMLPLNWGIIEIAKKTGAAIISVAIDYHENTCYVSIGEPLFFMPCDSQKDSIIKLTDTMATLRWEIWEKYSPDKRNNVSPEQFHRDVIQKAIDEYPKLDVIYEEKLIFKEK